MPDTPEWRHFLKDSETKEIPGMGDFSFEKFEMNCGGEMNFGKMGKGILLAACRDGNGFGLIGNA